METNKHGHTSTSPSSSGHPGFFGSQLTFLDQTSTNSAFNEKVFVLTSSLKLGPTFDPTCFLGSLLTLFRPNLNQLGLRQKRVWPYFKSRNSGPTFWTKTAFWAPKLTFFDQTSTNSAFNKNVFGLTSSLETRARPSTQAALSALNSLSSTKPRPTRPLTKRYLSLLQVSKLGANFCHNLLLRLCSLHTSLDTCML